MLTKRQIQRLAQRNRINMQAQERDYVQHLILYLLYTRTQELLFKGGTALRVIYGSNQYSEDLDFNSDLELRETKALFSQAINDLRTFGVGAAIRNEWESHVGYNFEVSFQGPLYDGRDITKGKTRVDVSLRREEVTVLRELISPEYDDVHPFLITSLSLDHILAEKVRALMIRRKPRDLYDIWFLLKKGLTINPKLVDRKLALYEMRFDPAQLESLISVMEKSWHRDLQPLLPLVPDFALVQVTVTQGLQPR